MNNKKITPERLESINMAIALGLPRTIIGKMFGVHETTINKHAGAKLIELQKSCPQNTFKELRLMLFNLYAWSVADLVGIMMAFGIKEEDVVKTQKVIFDYLHLDRFVSYCDGIINEIILHQKITFEEDVPESHRNFIKEVALECRNSYRGEKSPGKKLFKDLLVLLHSDESFIPNTSDILSPHLALKKVLDRHLGCRARKFKESGTDRKEYGPCIPKIFTDRVVKSLDTLTSREANVVKLFFGLGEDGLMTLEQIGEIFSLTRERVRQIKEKALRRMKHSFRFWGTERKEMVSVYDNAFKAYIVLAEELDKKKEIESELDFTKAIASDMAKFIALNIGKLEVDNFMISNMLKINPEVETILKDLISSDLQGIPKGLSDSKMELMLTRCVDCDFSLRLLNCLKSSDIDYVWQIICLPTHEFLKLRNLGKKSIIELEDFVGLKDLNFGTNLSVPIKSYLIGKTIGFEAAQKNRYWSF